MNATTQPNIKVAAQPVPTDPKATYIAHQHATRASRGYPDAAPERRAEFDLKWGAKFDLIQQSIQRCTQVPANDNFRQLPALPPMHPDPFTADAAGGILGDVSDWINSTAIIPVPELSLAAALALMGGLFGGRALGPTRTGVNLFVTTLLETAGGKGHPPKAIRALADACGAAGAATNGDPTSYAALERIMRRHSSTVVTMDEFGITLQDVNGRNASAPAASIRKFLLAIYDQADSVFDGRAYASEETKKNDTPIVGPALTVLGMTTPDTLYRGLSAASIADGFVNRFLFVSASRPAVIHVPKLTGRDAPPRELIARLRGAITAFPKGISDAPPASRTSLPQPAAKFVVPFSGGEQGVAYGRWCEVHLWQHSPFWTDTERRVSGRASENTQRLATLRAISRSPAEPSVTVEDVEWGWAITHRSIELILAGAAANMSASPAEALRKAILRALESGAVPHSLLMQRTGVSGATTRELEDALAWLLVSGEIVDLNGKPKPGRGSKYASNGVQN